jgi:hypothetical protein
MWKSRAERNREGEDKAIRYFLEHLASYYGESAKVIDRPDRRGIQGGCDAIVVRDAERWAIDVTELASYRGQRDRSARLSRYRACLEEAAHEAQPGRYVNIEIGPEDIPKTLTESDLKSHVKEGLSKLTDADFDNRHSDRQLGFSIGYWIEDARGDGEDCFLCLVTEGGRNVDQSGVLAERIAAKNRQLEKYKKEEYRTAAILDVWDISLSNSFTIADRFASLLPNLEHSSLDEIWLARSVTEPYRFLPLKLTSWLYRSTREDKESIRVHYRRRSLR